MEAFSARWNHHAVPIYQKHGLHNIGWWTTEQRDSDGNDLFVCLLAGENANTIQNSIAAFHKDPDWQKVEKETELNGKLRAKVDAFKLAPTPFSLLK